MLFEFIIPRRPVSLQTRNRNNLQIWKQFVLSEAQRSWSGPTVTNDPVQVTLVYLCDQNPVDIDNIIKPIQDALVNLVYSDDILVSDVDSHRRPYSGIVDITELPPILIQAFHAQSECVYVRIRTPPKPLETYL
ncbi:RusA family crossover junction endodeoxyribonuclease [Lacunimicrobium album]